MYIFDYFLSKISTRTNSRRPILITIITRLFEVNHCWFGSFKQRYCPSSHFTIFLVCFFVVLLSVVGFVPVVSIFRVHFHVATDLSEYTACITRIIMCFYWRNYDEVVIMLEVWLLKQKSKKKLFPIWTVRENCAKCPVRQQMNVVYW